MEHIASSSSGHHQARHGSAPEGDEAACWLLIVRHGLTPGGDEAAWPVQDQHGLASGGDEVALGLLQACSAVQGDRAALLSAPWPAGYFTGGGCLTQGRSLATSGKLEMWKKNSNWLQDCFKNALTKKFW